jgi:predicted acetyltransferase
MSDEIVLVRPSLHFANDFEKLAHEHLLLGETRYEEAARDILAFIRRCEDHEAGRGLREGVVPQATFWMVRNGERVLGCSRLRHRLTPVLAHEGGHVGYDVRPSERGKGYGTLLLRLTLDKARELGLAQVLVTADDANVASWKVIEKNGGRRESGDFRRAGQPFRRYWVPL